jgi:hypothetical protein
MARKHRGKRQSGRPDGRSPGPKRRLTRTFATLKDAAAAGDAVLAQPPAGHLIAFDQAILLRAVNALKSARLLLEAAHWEFAAAPARSLFELVVNLEYVNAQPNREQAAFRFAKFGVLQMIQSQLETAAYERQTGRPVDDERVAVLGRMLEVDYREFRVGKSEKPQWARTWSGKSTRDLAFASPSQPLRQAQYRQLFVAWSEQLHAAPAALLDGFFPRPGETLEKLMAEEDTRIAETGAMCVTLFLELWHLLPTLPTLERERIAGWRADLAAEARALGAPDPR